MIRVHVIIVVTVNVVILDIGFYMEEKYFTRECFIVFFQ